MVRRRSTLALLALLALLASTVPVRAAEDGAQDPSDAERVVHRAAGSVAFRVSAPTVLELDDSSRFHDTLEFRDGSMMNELSMDDYVAGIAEMPTRWPMEALKAQAVAARTYAWRSIESSSYSGYDICATVACQVFRGAGVELDSPTGHRWRAAVEETSGEVLVGPDGGPILARYFSTSGGRTYANEEVFPSSGSFEYLVGFEDPYDEVSPMHRWTARFTREEFDDILSRGTTVGAAVPVADVERVGAVDDPLATIRVTGVNGRRAEVGAVAFRDFVSRVSADRYPERFPGPREGEDTPLPATLPSSRFEVEVGEQEVVVHGQGWGHGVGMGQYGALGRAEDGATYDEILAVYYGGITPSLSDVVPERVRVGMSARAPVGVGADGPLTITVDGEPVEEDVLGTWSLERDDGIWVIGAPEGHGRPLQVAGTRPADGVARMRDAVTVEVEVNKPVLLDLEVTTPSGSEVLTRRLGVAEAGTHLATWRFDTAEGRLADPGEYRVALVAEDHLGERDGSPTSVTVPEPPVRRDPDREAPASPSVTSDPFVLSVTGALAIGAAGLLMLLIAIVLRRRR